MSWNSLAELLDERVAVARLKAGAAAREAQLATHSVEAQARADQAVSDLDHYVSLRERVGPDRSGPYRPGSRHSFFADCIRSAVDYDRDAEQRLTAAREMRSTSGNFGALVVPQTLEQLLADSGHNSRPLCDLLAQPLPDNGLEVTVPEVTTAVTAEDQATENTAVTADTPATTARSFGVKTIHSEVTVSQQSIDRAEGSGFDELVSREVLGACNALQEARVIAGSGSGGQPVGFLNASGVPTYSLTGTTAYDLLDAVGRTSAIVDGARSDAADLVVMHPRRWRWLLAKAGDRSAAITAINGPGPVVGRVLGLDVVATAAMPVTLGASSDEDRVIVVRRADVFVADAPPVVQVLNDNGDAGLLKTRVRVARYFASGVVSTEGVQVITGTGVKNPYA